MVNLGIIRLFGCWLALLLSFAVMFPSDWSERKSTAVVKRRKTQHSGDVRHLLEECGMAVGALGANGQDSALGGMEATPSSSQGGPVSDGPAPMDDLRLNPNRSSDTDGALLQHTSKSDTQVQEFPENVVDAIMKRVNDSKFAPPIPEELQLDHVLSGVPYQSMLESLFGGLTTSALDVPLVTKAYEESYMREAGPGESSCALGDLCECMFIDKNAPFVGVQFKLPVGSGCGSMPGHDSNSAASPGMCVLCCRKTTQKLFYDICYGGNRVQGLIQQYGNLCNQPGEYARCCMLVCPPTSPWHCMPRPIMSHQRNRYQVHVMAGLKHLQQLRVAHEDFAPPSDTMQA